MTVDRAEAGKEAAKVVTLLAIFYFETFRI